MQTPIYSTTLYSETTIKPKTGQLYQKLTKTDHTISRVISVANNFTLESNAYRQSVYLNPALDFSSRNGWDIEIASYNITVYGGGAQNYKWDSYINININISKTFAISPRFKTVIGTQNGTTAFSTVHQLHHVDYGLIIYQPLPTVNFHARPYWANKALTVTTDYLGYTAGFSFESVKNKLSVQGDYFGGSNNVSGVIMSIYYRILPKAQLYVGIGVPETNSGNDFYGTVGFSLASK